MVREIYIPREVKDSIKKHLDKSIKKARDGFESAYEEEDTLTGHLFGLMKINQQKVTVYDEEGSGVWKWYIDYKKFGSRGKGSTESIIGADGIIELHLFRNGSEVSKSLLFQSKINWANRDKKLYEQCSKLITWIGAVTLINYTEDQFETYSLGQILLNKGSKPEAKKDLSDLLGVDFIDCKIGDNDLFYDAVRKKLIWLDYKRQYVACKFNLNRRLQIKIKAPNKYIFENINIDKEISAKDISKHPLLNDNPFKDITRVKNLQELRTIKNELSKVYHPDSHPLLLEKQKDSMSEIMKHINDLIDKQKIKIKK